MYFISKKVSEFAKKKLNYSDATWHHLQQDYLYMLQIYIELEINAYLESNNLTEERDRLLELSRKDEAGSELAMEFWKIYENNEEIHTKVDARMAEYNDKLLTAFVSSLSTQSREQFKALIDQELDKYTQAREKMDKILGSEV